MMNNVTVDFDTSSQTIAGSEMSLAVIPEILADSSPLLNTTGLEARGAIKVSVAVATVIGSGASVIIAGNAAVDLYDNIAAKIKAKSNANSCTLTYGTDSDDGYYEGYAYEATTTGSNCDTTALLKTIQTAVKKCATDLSTGGATRGCCKFTHGGTWTGHLRLTAEPVKFPVTSVTC